MRMLGTRVDLQLGQLGPREAVAGQHALDGLAQHLGRLPVELLAQRPGAEPARIAGVPVVHLLVELLARDLDLLRVHDHDEVARVGMRGVLGLPLATQSVRDGCREPAESLPVGVDDVPVAGDLARLCAVGLHA